MWPVIRDAAGLAQQPVAHLVDEPGLLGDGDEMMRRDQPARGMLPADQRFQADDGLVAAPHLRLVVDDQFVALRQRDPELILDRAAHPHGFVHRRGEHPVAVAALRLGAVEGDVGLAHQVDAVAAGRRDGADAHAHPDEDIRSAEIERQADRLDDALAEGLNILSASGVDAKDRELVSAEPRNGIALAHEAGDALAELADQHVPGGMTEGIVDMLKTVEIKQQQRAGLARGDDVV
jgi:hypothetical protein